MPKSKEWHAIKMIQNPVTAKWYVWQRDLKYAIEYTAVGYDTRVTIDWKQLRLNLWAQQ
jgi:hypothetical protein